MTGMDEVIAKIQKLMALGNAGKNNSAEEAASALAKAQELLAKYGLEASVIQDATAKKSDNAMEGMAPREKVQVKRSAMYRWQQVFWHNLATIHNCKHWVLLTYEGSKKVKRHVILGSQVNVATVQMMGDYLTEVMERELPYPNVERLCRSAINWREGMAQRLIERLEAKAEELRTKGFTAADGSTVTALAVQDLHEREYAANYDFQYGPGAYARNKANQARWTAENAEREAQAREEHEKMLGSETPEQRAAREQREAKEAAKQAVKDAKWAERYWARQEREAAKKDLTAYARGYKKANSINLDSQVKGN